MKRTLLIEREIEAGDKTCVGCAKIGYRTGGRCNLFEIACYGDRLPACLEAERRGMEVKR